MKNFFKFAFPFILAAFLTAFFNSVDVAVLSRGENGHEAAKLAATSGQILYIFINGIVGLCAGITIILGQNQKNQQQNGGQGDGIQQNNDSCGNESNAQAAQNCAPLSATPLIVTGAITALCVTVLLIFAPLFLKASAFDGDITVATKYLRLGAFSLIPCGIFNCLTGIIRGKKDTVKPLIAAGIAAVINLGATLLFVFVFHFGALSAMWSQIIAYSVGSIVLFILSSPKTTFGSIQMPDKENFKLLAKTCLPLMAFNIAASISFACVISAVNMFVGKETQSIGAALRINAFITLPPRALGSAFAAMLAMEGSNAQDKKNLVRYACVLGGIYGIFFLILSLSLPSQLLTFAGGGGSKILMFMAADSILVPIASLLAGKLEGSNKQTVSGVIGAAISLAVRIPLAFALGKAFGLNGVAIAIPLSSLALIIGMLIANIVISKKQKESEATYYVAKQY